MSTQFPYIKICVISVLILLFSVNSRPALASEEIVVPEFLVSGKDRLTMNGDAIRNAFFMDVYHCAVYTKSPASDISNQGDSSPIAIRIEILMDGMPNELPDRWQETIIAEAGPEVLHSLAHGFAGLKRGDILLLSFTPGYGTRVFKNDQLILHHHKATLIRAVLDVWVGDKPVSRSLKKELLG